MVSGLYVAPAELKGDYNSQFMWAFTHPFSIANSKTPAWVGIGFIGWFFFVNYYMVHYRDFHSEMEHGDEDWLDSIKASKELMDKDDKFNRILSENVKATRRNHGAGAGSTSCSGGISPLRGKTTLPGWRFTRRHGILL